MIGSDHMQSISAASGREAVRKKENDVCSLMVFLLLLLCVGGGWLDMDGLRASSSGSIFVKNAILTYRPTPTRPDEVDFASLS
jgi:hypothetical protein